MEIQNRSQVSFFTVFGLKKSCYFLLRLHLPKNDKEWFLGGLGSLFWPKTKLNIFPTFCICRPNPCAYCSDFFSSSRNLSDMRMDLVGKCKMSGKWSIFCLARINFLKLPKLIFYRFWGKIRPSENCMTFSGQKVLKTSLESDFEFPLSICTEKKKSTQFITKINKDKVRKEKY